MLKLTSYSVYGLYHKEDNQRNKQEIDYCLNERAVANRYFRNARGFVSLGYDPFKVFKIDLADYDAEKRHYYLIYKRIDYRRKS